MKMNIYLFDNYVQNDKSYRIGIMLSPFWIPVNCAPISWLDIQGYKERVSNTK